jgi:hypothetical protein
MAVVAFVADGGLLGVMPLEPPTGQGTPAPAGQQAHSSVQCVTHKASWEAALQRSLLHAVPAVKHGVSVSSVCQGGDLALEHSLCRSLVAGRDWQGLPSDPCAFRPLCRQLCKHDCKWGFKAVVT